MRTLTRIIAALNLVLALAAPARAAVPAEEEAWILGSGLTVRDWGLQFPGHVWGRTVTVRSEGAVEGRAGNRHTATFDYRDGYRRFPILWSLELTDEQCAGAACTTVWHGRADSLRLTDADLGPVAADGAVHVAMPLRGSDFQPTAPFATAGLDVTVTPVGWSDPRTVPSLAGQSQVTRYASTDEAVVQSPVNYLGDRVTASGQLAGVPAREAVAGSWYDYGYGTGRVGEPLGPATTRAQMLAYAPPQRNGRVTQASQFDVTLAGEARGTLVTSAGKRLRGNAVSFHLYPQVRPAPGGALAGTVAGLFSAVTYECPAATTPIQQCAAYENPLQSIAGDVPLRYVVSPLGVAGLQATLPVTRVEREGEPGTSLGSLTFVAALVPNGPGVVQRTGTIDRVAGTWSETRTLTRPLAGPVRLGPLTVTGEPGYQGNPFEVRTTTDRGGSL